MSGRVKRPDSRIHAWICVVVPTTPRTAFVTITPVKHTKLIALSTKSTASWWSNRQI